MRCDFADVFEVKSGKAIRRGSITTVWSPEAQALRTAYANQDFQRSVTVHAQAGRHDVLRQRAAELRRGARARASLALLPALRSWRRRRLAPAPDRCAHEPDPAARRQGCRRLEDSVLRIHTANEEVYRTFQQAVDDMAALRLPQQEADGMGFVPAAGLPWFTALFGRDSLIASLQTMLIYPEFAAATLEVLGARQATERDDYRDAEPGKILHEMRFGELAHFKLIPHTPYYGTADATPLYLITLHEAWRWTGDRALLERQMPVAERCLPGSTSGATATATASRNTRRAPARATRTWAGRIPATACVNLDGTLVRGPKALCELQGYVYDAWQRMAGMFDALGDAPRAPRCAPRPPPCTRASTRRSGTRRRALRLLPGWREEAGAERGLQSRALPVVRHRAAGSRGTRGGAADGAGHVVGLGHTHAVGRPRRFNPYSYQLGAVWPHDNAIIAMGFRRYGFAAEAGQIARDLSEAASHFLLNQMPELYARLQRTPTGFPVQYVGANVPQAWAAGSVFMTAARDARACGRTRRTAGWG